ncbi:MAG: hypothetical protein ACFE8M_10490 [Candidatus Hermodarchaeota archaeon]
MTAIKIHNKLERLIDSLIITENQKIYLRNKANDLYNELKFLSQNRTSFWSTFYSSINGHQYTLERFLYRGSFGRGIFIKNRFDIDIYIVYKVYPYGQNNLTGRQLFNILYSNLKAYQSNYRENMKILKNPPYGHVIPIRMDYQGISILFDCIPAIELTNGYLIIPDGIGGTKKLNLKLEEQAISKLNKKQNGKITKLIILIKYWNFNWGKSLKGYLIEQLVESIFDKIKVYSWDRAVKTFFNRAVYFMNKFMPLPDGVYNQFSILNEFSSNELNNFLDVFREAEIYAQKGKWEKLFSDL